jgi:dipeptidyl aminopeptidase/acylaminoacyl peptidase
LLIEERFNNIEVVKAVKCPTAILHGMSDEIVDCEDSLDLLTQGFISC